MYRKIIALLLSAFILMSLVSCSKNEPAQDNSQTSDTAEEVENLLPISNPNTCVVKTLS